jgi:hypothetical protein
LLPLVYVTAGPDQFNGQHALRLIDAVQHPIAPDPKSEQITPRQGFDPEPAAVRIPGDGLDRAKGTNDPPLLHHLERRGTGAKSGALPATARPRRRVFPVPRRLFPVPREFTGKNVICAPRDISQVITIEAVCRRLP